MKVTCPAITDFRECCAWILYLSPFTSRRDATEGKSKPRSHEHDLSPLRAHHHSQLNMCDHTAKLPPELRRMVCELVSRVSSARLTDSLQNPDIVDIIQNPLLTRHRYHASRSKMSVSSASHGVTLLPRYSGIPLPPIWTPVAGVTLTPSSHHNLAISSIAYAFLTSDMQACGHLRRTQSCFNCLACCHEAYSRSLPWTMQLIGAR